MVTKYVDVDGKWGVLLNYDFDMWDWDDIRAICKSFGMKERNIERALHVLSAPNTGMTVSNNELRMTAIFIGKSTSNGEFWSTVNHELLHAEQAILDYYGVDWDGEPPAYLAGYLLKCVVEEIAEICY